MAARVAENLAFDARLVVWIYSISPRLVDSFDFLTVTSLISVIMYPELQ